MNCDERIVVSIASRDESNISRRGLYLDVASRLGIRDTDYDSARSLMLLIASMRLSGDYDDVIDHAINLYSANRRPEFDFRRRHGTDLSIIA